jgi:hypothetical protein
VRLVRVRYTGLLGPIFEHAVYNLFSSFVQTAVLRFSQTLKVSFLFNSFHIFLLNICIYIFYIAYYSIMLTISLSSDKSRSGAEVGGAVASSGRGHADGPGQR